MNTEQIKSELDQLTADYIAAPSDALAKRHAELLSRLQLSHAAEAERCRQRELERLAAMGNERRRLKSELEASQAERAKLNAELQAIGDRRREVQGALAQLSIEDNGRHKQLNRLDHFEAGNNIDLADDSTWHAIAAEASRARLKQLTSS